MARPDEPTDLLRRTLMALLPTFVWGADAAAQDASKMQPDSYRVVLETDRLRVLDFLSRPGMGMCGIGMHSHPPHLTVALTAAKVRVRNADGTTFVGENQPGDVFWDEAVTHTTENILGRNARALIVELKAPKCR